VIRDWYKYHNKQNYSDCQLISAVNAYYYLTGKVIPLESKRYEKMVDLVCARNGAAISIKKAHKRLGIESIWEGDYLPDAQDKDGKMLCKYKILLPCEVSVWHPKTGFHSVLIVGHNKECRAYQVTNFRWETTTGGWIFEEDFKVFVNASNLKSWKYRILGKRR